MPFLEPAFFQRDVLVVARELVGVELVWKGCSGLIVETEAYAVEGDPACHTASRPSAREFVTSRPPGAAYVYFNYGMYWLFNLLVKGGERDGLILIRALEPRKGLPSMQSRRNREKPAISAPAPASWPRRSTFMVPITACQWPGKAARPAAASKAPFYLPTRS